MNAALDRIAAFAHHEAGPLVKAAIAANPSFEKFLSARPQVLAA